MTKKNLIPIIVLTSICVIVAALLGGVNELTKGRIKQNALKKEQASLREVLPDSVIFEELEITSADGLPSTVKSAYRETAGKGYVLILATRSQYSAEDMTISVGISTDGKVSGVKITNYKESKDFGKTTYPNKYVGATADTYDEVEVTSGVTVSSNAFKAAIGDALRAANILASRDSAMAGATLLSAKSGAGQSSDSALPSLVSILVSGKDFSEVTLPSGAPSTLKKLYQVSDGGYVAYIVVAGEYVPVATEGLIYVGTSGKIENVNLISWVVGHGVEPGDFADRFVGKNAYSIFEVELVSGATWTALDFYNEVDASLNLITDLLGARERAYLDMIKSMIPNSKDMEKIELPEEAKDTLKVLYKDTSGKGCVAHLVVPGEYVPVATEAYVYFNQWGEIKDVKLVQWVVGHGIGPDDFASRFIGKTKYTVGGVELVSGATWTASDFRQAVSDAFPYVPISFPVWRVVGIVILSIAVVGFITASVVSKKRRSAKR